MNFYFKILLLLLIFADNLVAEETNAEESVTSTVSVSTPASEQTPQVVKKESSQDTPLKDVDVEKKEEDGTEKINLRRNIQGGLDQSIPKDTATRTPLKNAGDFFSPVENEDEDPLAGTDPRLETRAPQASDSETKVTASVDLTSGFATEPPATTKHSARCVQVDRRSFEYRKALDGGFVEFVQAQRLPVYQEDLNVCPNGTSNHTSGPTTPRSSAPVLPITPPTEGTTAEPAAELPAEEVINTATKATIDEKVTDEHKQGDVRRSEYLFSSLEYYDEVINFDASVCAADVEEITLEQDSIRPYDVECSKMLEWRSLEGYT